MLHLLTLASLVICTLGDGYTSGHDYYSIKSIDTPCGFAGCAIQTGSNGGGEFVGPVINNGQVSGPSAFVGSTASARAAASSFGGDSIARAAASASSHVGSARASSLARTNGILGVAGATAQAFRPGFVNQFVYQSYRPYHYYSSQFNPYFYSKLSPIYHGYGFNLPYSINYIPGNRGEASAFASSVARGFDARASAQAAAAVGSGVHAYDGIVGSGPIISGNGIDGSFRGQPIIGSVQGIGDDSLVGGFNGFRRRVVRKKY